MVEKILSSLDTHKKELLKNWKREAAPQPGMLLDVLHLRGLVSALLPKKSLPR